MSCFRFPRTPAAIMGLALAAACQVVPGQVAPLLRGTLVTGGGPAPRTDFDGPSTRA